MCASPVVGSLSARLLLSISSCHTPLKPMPTFPDSSLPLVVNLPPASVALRRYSVTSPPVPLCASGLGGALVCLPFSPLFFLLPSLGSFLPFLALDVAFRSLFSPSPPCLFCGSPLVRLLYLSWPFPSPCVSPVLSLVLVRWVVGVPGAASAAVWRPVGGGLFSSSQFLPSLRSPICYFPYPAFPVPPFIPFLGFFPCPLVLPSPLPPR